MGQSPFMKQILRETRQVAYSVRCDIFEISCKGALWHSFAKLSTLSTEKEFISGHSYKVAMLSFGKYCAFTIE